MKKILIALLAAAMLFAFTACDDDSSSKDVPDVEITTVDQLKAFASGETDNEELKAFAAADYAAITKDITLSERVTIARDNVRLAGNGGKITVSNVPAYNVSGETGIINLAGDKVIVEGLEIAFTGEGTGTLYVISAMGNNCEIKECVISGNETADTVGSGLHLNGIDAYINASNTIISGNTVKGTRMPVYFETGSTGTKVSGNTFENYLKIDVDEDAAVEFTGNTFKSRFTSNDYDIKFLSTTDKVDCDAISKANNNAVVESAYIAE